MNKDQATKDARAKYVQERINKSKNSSKEVAKLSKELFLSQQTIERDLKR